ncbi:MAG: thioredoxin family protein [Oscillospiraceae bacterium]|nr:thioredoxin family protein [Oscillospiraceae bacterium]
MENIKVLGLVCKTCHQQLENVRTAVSSLGLSAEVEYLTDMEKIMEYGVMSLPAIVIDEKVAAHCKLLKTKDVEKLLGG